MLSCKTSGLANRFLLSVFAVLALFASANAATLDHYVEYLDTDGASATAGEYVLLDYTPTAETVVELEMAIIATSDSAAQGIFCSRDGGAENTFNLMYYYRPGASSGGRGFRWDYNAQQSGYVYNSTACVEDLEKHLVRCSCDGVYVDGTKTIDSSSISTSFTPTQQMTLFMPHTASGMANKNYARMRLYSFKAFASAQDYSDGVPSVWLRPCVDSDGVVCLYDEVNERFYYNQVSGTTFAAGPEAGNIDASNFSYSMDIAPASGSVSSTLMDFPLLVRLSSTLQDGFKPSQCGSNGSGLRFALPDGRLLDHEIDTWDPSGESLVWVKVPSLSATSVITAYWGARDASALPEVQATNVWANYIGVWHLDEENGTAYDSSANGLDMSVGSRANPPVAAETDETYDTTGKVGVGRYLPEGTAGSTDSGSLFRSHESAMAAGSAFSFSGWFRIDSSTANYPLIVQKRTDNDASSGRVGWLLAWYNGLKTLTLHAGSTNADRATFDNGESVETETWYHVCAVVNEMALSIYLDGTLAGSGTSDSVTSESTSDPLVFGRAWAGAIDEFRYNGAVLSPARIAADYAQIANTAFLSYGEIKGASPTLIMIR